MKNKQSLKFVGRSSSQSSGFTLIELLVVIAIIAILAAIIFPVFSTLQENARQNNTMEHMHDISSGLALYKLDNKSYPPVLFGYACDSNSKDGCKISDNMSTIASDPNAKNELVGLYPEYVRDWHSFTCASDTLNDPDGAMTTAVGGSVQPNYIDPNFNLVKADGSTSFPYRTYYLEDSFDISPVVSADSTLDTSTSPYLYTIRYQTAWTSNDPNYDATLTTGDSPFWADYQRQLQWRNPPANTYVTAVTAHVATANKLIVLYEGGDAKNVAYQAANGQPEIGWDDQTQTNIAPTTTTTTSTTGTTSNVEYVAAGFWRFNATGS